MSVNKNKPSEVSHGSVNVVVVVVLVVVVGDVVVTVSVVMTCTL